MRKLHVPKLGDNQYFKIAIRPPRWKWGQPVEQIINNTCHDIDSAEKILKDCEEWFTAANGWKGCTLAITVESHPIHAIKVIKPKQ